MSNILKLSACISYCLWSLLKVTFKGTTSQITFSTVLPQNFYFPAKVVMGLSRAAVYRALCKFQVQDFYDHYSIVYKTIEFRTLPLEVKRTRYLNDRREN